MSRDTVLPIQMTLLVHKQHLFFTLYQIGGEINLLLNPHKPHRVGLVHPSPDHSPH